MNCYKLEVAHLQIVPSKILGPKRNYINGEWSKYNGNFLIYTSSSDMVKMVESRKLQWFAYLDG
jgi:hypothetical protein